MLRNTKQEDGTGVKKSDMSLLRTSEVSDRGRVDFLLGSKSKSLVSKSL